MRYFMISALILGSFFSYMAAQSNFKSDFSGSEPIVGDPIKVQEFTLKNGLKLFLSVNKQEPRIFTNIAVRAGSKYDPAETTGLAHYLEHMMFKGTHKIAALDWEKEKVMLQKISDLYEAHKKETDPEKRAEIYKLIDAESQTAATLVAANEYDKMMSSIGAKATNAYTFVEQTVYVNDIPANELEKWMKLESERFSTVVLRLFHTEMEAVYEEYNINLDRDFRKVMKSMCESLWPTHPYGTQTTIGRGEHLKSPSHVNIMNYFDKYYVPNNMAIILAGDFDPQEVVRIAEKYWGGMKPKPITRPTFPVQAIPNGRVYKEVYGQESPYLQFGWPCGGSATPDPDILLMIDKVLNNGQCGLLDLNVIQKQRILEGSSWMYDFEDHSAFGLTAKPREGQSLEDVEKILLAEIEKIKKGEFDAWILRAGIRDLKLSEIRSSEFNQARVGSITDAFVKGIDWKDYVNRYQRLEKITKKDLIAFANKYFTNNFVVVYKKSGEDKNIQKVEKPKITPVKINREVSTDYGKAFFAEKSPSLKPEFLDFKKEIASSNLKNNIRLDYVKNDLNPLFSLYYVLEMGKFSDEKLPIAINYLPFLGTDKLSPEALKKEFYKLGVNFDVFSSDDRVYVSLTGLQESFIPGIKLFEHILSNCKPNEEALKNMVSDLLTERENAKKDKRTILRGALSSYGKFGPNSPFTDILKESELNAITSTELTDKIHDLTSYEHSVYYYGPENMQKVVSTLNRLHKTPKVLKPVLKEKSYQELDNNMEQVLFVHFPTVQTEFILQSKGSPNFSLEQNIMSDLYNNYFGAGLSSIVFQEIRESKALAYSASTFFSSPSRIDKAHYLTAYIGTQSDKLKDAMPALRNIIENMPVSESQITNAIDGIKKRVESERTKPMNIYWQYLNAKKLGLDRDTRKDLYEKMKTVTSNDLTEFQKKYVKGRKYNILVMGDRTKVDLEFLKTLGPYKEVSMEEIFGY
jgi:zinc protease